MTTLSLAAVSCLGRQGGVAPSANHLFGLVLSGESDEGWLDFDAAETAAAKAEHEVQGGLFLDVVVGEGAAVFELLSGEDETLLIWGDAFLILNLGFDVINGVAGLDIQSYRLAGEGLDENLHI